MPKRKSTILVVDGDTLHREALRRILRAEGYRVLDAADYQNAINVLHQHHGEINLLLTAISLSGGNGYELAKVLAEIEPGLKVLLVSGQAGAKVSRFYSKVRGNWHVLARPFSAGDLLDRVNQILESAGPFAAGASF